MDAKRKCSCFLGYCVPSLQAGQTDAEVLAPVAQNMLRLSCEFRYRRKKMAGACVYEVHSLRGHVQQMLWVSAVTAGFGRRRHLASHRNN